MEDLCLTFSLPGAETVPLRHKSEYDADEVVTGQTLPLYVQRVLQVTLEEGVRPQVQAMLEGLHEVVPPGALKIFTENELMAMIAGQGAGRSRFRDSRVVASACATADWRG